MSSLPDTYAGGQFNLPLKVAKLVRLIEGTENIHEKLAGRIKLADFGWCLDEQGILWDLDKIPKFVKQGRPSNRQDTK